MLGELHRFWRPLWLSRSAYRDIALGTVFLNLLAIALPVYMRVVYDRVVPNFAEATLWVLSLGMLLVVGFEVLFKVSRSYLTEHLGNRAAARLEQEFQQHLLSLPEGYSIARTNQYFALLQDIRDFFCQKLVPTLVDTPFVLTFLLAIALICPGMALVPVVAGGIIIGLQYAFHSVLHSVIVRQQHAAYQRQSALVETLNGRDTIRQLAAGCAFTGRWQDVTQNAAVANADMSIWYGLTQFLCGAVIALNSVCLIIVGVYEIKDNNLSVGGLLAISLLSGRLLAPLTGIGSILSKLSHMKSEMRMIEDVLALPADLPESDERFALQGALVVQQLTMHYSGHALPSLRDVTFSLAQGQKLGLIGPSGAGKTTLMRCLSAELRPGGGLIRWDERDITHIPPAALRSQMGIVDQYPYFFARTLRDNLSIGIERSDEEIHQALEVAGLDALVKSAGRGLDLMIEEGGVNLSGGQRQCLAIARALLRGGPVLFMDEPTSMMDHVMEARLVTNLKPAIRDKTVILITHRTPLLALLDSVAVLDQGRLVRFGPRAEILKELTGAEGRHAAG
jgi:ATP-binding cassette subfamily C protein LapB